ncbi:MAG: hypothetical protein L6R39_002020 [Caloplaca ligustica]|nr:MAG: hypothetical protein L6R39_002020 [Caloplaca ligustica]
MSNIFITSASGHIGTPLVPLLLKSALTNNIVLPTTNLPRREARVPKSDRITILDGSIQNPAWVEEKFQKYNISTIFLCLTGVDELFTTCNFLSALVRSVCMLQQSKVFREEGRTYTILGPSLFFTNDLRGKETMMGPMDVYGEPIGTKGVSRVDVEDIALVVVKVAEDPKKWDGRKVMVGSKRVYTEHDFGRYWSEALGKPIQVAPNNRQGLDQLEMHVSKGINPMWARDIRLMYELFGKMAFALTDEEYETQKELLGKEPNDYEEFAKKTGAEWIKELVTMK